ncbi:nuclease-related domain-containing protein [Fictibacillus sp. b24]|uniref:nuclease-related domain-containing protein n=1 Tax=Fictibacillus sp. b24 TaxID=3055863 RepID=UPI0025A1764C|nr:nuclease-related domain-containing protein [Fictibacillus sp. b24]MDM5317087.1 nuclease-related domain-containing protein [Fictibacillus sp. b24]
MPIFIQKLEALLRRVSPTHPNRVKIAEDLAKSKSGITGERSLQYFYRYLPQDKVRFLHHIRISHMDYYFQVDTLLLTNKFLLLLEIKNYAGHLYFDEKHGQLIRTLNNKRDIFEDPLLQAKRQAFHLSKIINKHKYPSIPIETMVVFTHPKAYIECSPTYKEAMKRVIKSSKLEEKFVEFSSKYKQELFSVKEVKKMSRLLNKLHEPYDPNICVRYGIGLNELINGVICPQCEDGMYVIKQLSKWRCERCGVISNEVLIHALRDYALLVSTTITNKSCQSYLNISPRQSQYLLKALQIPFYGSNKGRTYHLDSLIT